MVSYLWDKSKVHGMKKGLRGECPLQGTASSVFPMMWQVKIRPFAEWDIQTRMPPTYSPLYSAHLGCAKFKQYVDKQCITSPFGENSRTDAGFAVHRRIYPQAVGLWIIQNDQNEESLFLLLLLLFWLKNMHPMQGIWQESSVWNANISRNGIFSTGMWMIPPIHPQFVPKQKAVISRAARAFPQNPHALLLLLNINISTTAILVLGCAAYGNKAGFQIACMARIDAHIRLEVPICSLP